MTIQFTDDELYQLFLVVDSRCREGPTNVAIEALREKLLPVYRARHAKDFPWETDDNGNRIVASHDRS